MAWSSGTVLTAALLNLHAPQREAAVAVPAANANYTSASTAYRGGRVITVYITVTMVASPAANQICANIPASMAPPVAFSTTELIDQATGASVLCSFGTGGSITISPSRTAGQVLTGKVTYVQ